jgi:hypothetical protein
MRGFRLFGVTLITSMLSLVSAAQTGDPIAAIQQRLNSQINVTRITADRSDIVAPGDVVVIHRPGLVMYAVFSPMPPSNSYKNGKIGQGWGGFGKDLAIGMATPGAGTAASYPHRTFVPEEKCWVTGIQVQKDGVLFQLYSDPYGDTRFYANLKIPFPDKKVVPPVDVALQTVAEVLTVVPPENQGGQPAQGQGGQPAPGPDSIPAANSAQDGQPALVSGKYLLENGGRQLIFVSKTSVILLVPGGQSRGQYAVNGDTLTVTLPSTGQSLIYKIQADRLIADNGEAWIRKGGAAPAPAPAVAPVAPPAPAQYGDIAPPPPPPTPAPTISLGQTKAQVAASFGEPVRKAVIGAKEIFVYKDMKVTFTNGKVSNVE